MGAGIRLMLIVAAAAFGLASAIHAGLLIAGWEHPAAAMAEGVIAAVLALGVLGTLVRPAAARGIALAALGFALLGTLVGAFTILVGVGPRTVPDVVFHALLVVGLVAALVRAWGTE
jgi:hypothetical protein